jgi:tRNA A37 threonylcarbamoyladenosine dehydratase
MNLKNSSGIMESFLCTELLIGKEKLKKLQASSVTVIGLGAVGSYAVEALTRFGVGNIRMVDFDEIKPTNMNRHPYALVSTLGKNKARVAKERILEINPSCNAEALQVFAAEETMDNILDNNPDAVIDAIDSFNPKAQVLAACYNKGIPVVSAMGAALRTDPFSIKKGDLFAAKGCPLAGRIRKKLRKMKIESGILCVYSDQKEKLSVKDAGAGLNEKEFERGRKRRKLGSLPTVTGIFGLVAAHCAVEILCGGFIGK